MTILVHLSYIGPGLGAGVVATILATLVAVFLFVVGILWYPFKRMLKKRRQRQRAQEDAVSDSATGEK